MEDAYTLSRKSVDMLTCTAQVVAEHLDHGYVTSEDATRLRAATKEVETEVTNQYLQPSAAQQRMLWGD